MLYGYWLQIGVRQWDQHWDRVVLLVGSAGSNDGTNSAPCWRQLSEVRRGKVGLFLDMILKEELRRSFELFQFIQFVNLSTLYL